MLFTLVGKNPYPAANWDGSAQLPTTWTAGAGMAVGESTEVVQWKWANGFQEK